MTHTGLGGTEVNKPQGIPTVAKAYMMSIDKSCIG